MFIALGSILIILTLLAYRRGHFNGGLYEVDRKTQPFRFHSFLITQGLLGLVLIVTGLLMLPK